jgi:hypothetical protein
MELNKNSNLEKVGKILGCILAYILFTTVLYFILVLTNKIPKEWTYNNIIIITILITFTGFVIKRILK